MYYCLVILREVLSTFEIGRWRLGRSRPEDHESVWVFMSENNAVWMCMNLYVYDFNCTFLTKSEQKESKVHVNVKNQV